LKTLNAVTVAECTEKDSTQHDIRVVIYHAKEASGADYYGVMGVAKALSIIPGGTQKVLTYSIDETFRAENSDFNEINGELVITSQNPQNGSSRPSELKLSVNPGDYASADIR